MYAFHSGALPALAVPSATACTSLHTDHAMLQFHLPHLCPTGQPCPHPDQQQNSNSHQPAAFSTSIMKLLNTDLVCTQLCSQPIMPPGSWPLGHWFCGPHRAYTTARSVSCWQREDNHGAPTTLLQPIKGKSDTGRAQPVRWIPSLGAPVIFFN